MKGDYCYNFATWSEIVPLDPRRVHLPDGPVPASFLSLGLQRGGVLHLPMLRATSRTTSRRPAPWSGVVENYPGQCANMKIRLCPKFPFNIESTIYNFLHGFPVDNSILAQILCKHWVCFWMHPSSFSPTHSLVWWNPVCRVPSITQ